MPRNANSRVLPLWPVVAILVVLAGASALTGVAYFRVRSQQAVGTARLETENQELRRRSETLGKELESLRRGASLAPQAAPEPVQPGQSHPAGKLEDSRFVYQLRDKLAAATASIESLQKRVQELQISVDAAKQESAKLAASEAETREKLNSANRVLEAVQTDVKTKGDRLTQAEITNRLLKDENRALSDKVNQVPSALRELEEINRRRETYAGNVLRRYKEVTEHYRAMSDRLDRPDAAAGAGADLSRISNAISMAEEDLRQLTALNAQAVRVRQKLNGK